MGRLVSHRPSVIAICIPRRCLWSADGSPHIRYWVAWAPCRNILGLLGDEILLQYLCRPECAKAWRQGGSLHAPNELGARAANSLGHALRRSSLAVLRCHWYVCRGIEQCCCVPSLLPGRR